MLSNLKSQMRKGLLEYCILSIIHQSEAYASDILDTLKEAQLLVVEGTVYPLLTRMTMDFTRLPVAATRISPLLMAIPIIP
mgnify:CR=1 FL=1